LSSTMICPAACGPRSLGILAGFVICRSHRGRRLGSAKASRGRLVPPAGWAAIIGSGAVSAWASLLAADRRPCLEGGARRLPSAFSPRFRWRPPQPGRLPRHRGRREGTGPGAAWIGERHRDPPSRSTPSDHVRGLRTPWSPSSSTATSSAPLRPGRAHRARVARRIWRHPLLPAPAAHRRTHAPSSPRRRPRPPPNRALLADARRALPAPGRTATSDLIAYARRSA
jgi:hypothetical protein